MAHASNDQREEFQNMTEASPEGPEYWSRMWTLTGDLWNCTDVMPSAYCDILGIAPGATYAMGARKVRNRLRTNVTTSVLET